MKRDQLSELLVLMVRHLETVDLVEVLMKRSGSLVRKSDVAVHIVGSLKMAAQSCCIEVGLG
jgi:hypothetical protein